MVRLASTCLSPLAGDDAYALCEVNGGDLRLHWVSLTGGFGKLLVIVYAREGLLYAWARVGVIAENIVFESMLAIAPQRQPSFAFGSKANRVAVFLDEGVWMSDEIKSTTSPLSFVAPVASWVTDYSLYKNYVAFDSETVVDVAQSLFNDVSAMICSIDKTTNLASTAWCELDWTKNKLRVLWRLPLLHPRASVAMLASCGLIGCGDRLMLVSAAGPVLFDARLSGVAFISSMAPLYSLKAETHDAALLTDSNGRVLKCDVDRCASLRTQEVALVLSDAFDQRMLRFTPQRLCLLTGLEGLSKGLLSVAMQGELCCCLLASSAAQERVSLVSLAMSIRRQPTSLASRCISWQSDSIVLGAASEMVRVDRGVGLVPAQECSVDLGPMVNDARLLAFGGASAASEEVLLVSSRVFCVSAVLQAPAHVHAALIADETTIACFALSDQRLVQITSSRVLVCEPSGATWCQALSPLLPSPVAFALCVLPRVAQAVESDRIVVYGNGEGFVLEVGTRSLQRIASAPSGALSSVAAHGSYACRALWDEAGLWVDSFQDGCVHSEFVAIPADDDVPIRTVAVHAAGQFLTVLAAVDQVVFAATKGVLGWTITQCKLPHAPAELQVLRESEVGPMGPIFLAQCGEEAFVLIARPGELSSTRLLCPAPHAVWAATATSFLALTRSPDHASTLWRYPLPPTVAFDGPAQGYVMHSCVLDGDVVDCVQSDGELLLAYCNEAGDGVGALSARDLRSLRVLPLPWRVKCVAPPIACPLGKGELLYVVVENGGEVQLVALHWPQGLVVGRCPLTLSVASPVHVCRVEVDGAAMLVVASAREVALVGWAQAQGQLRLAKLVSVTVEGMPVALVAQCSAAAATVTVDAARCAVVDFSCVMEAVANGSAQPSVVLHGTRCKYQAQIAFEGEVPLPVLGMSLQRCENPGPSGRALLALIAAEREGDHVFCMETALPCVEPPMWQARPRPFPSTRLDMAAALNLPQASAVRWRLVNAAGHSAVVD